jgi:MbtH protein
MANPFEAPDADYAVLRNQQNQHSLWLADVAVPAGWTVAHGPGPREECLAYVREHWVDIRPTDVAEFIAVVSR